MSHHIEGMVSSTAADCPGNTPALSLSSLKSLLISLQVRKSNHPIAKHHNKDTSRMPGTYFGLKEHEHPPSPNRMNKKEMNTAHFSLCCSKEAEFCLVWLGNTKRDVTAAGGFSINYINPPTTWPASSCSCSFSVSIAFVTKRTGLNPAQMHHSRPVLH